MTYKTLMVHVDIGSTNEHLFRVAGDLAERFDASVMGIAACQSLPIMYYGDAYLMTDVIERDRVHIEAQMKVAEERFRTAFGKRANDLDWRSACLLDGVTDFVAHQARAADLILIDPSGGGTDLEASRRVDVGDLVMRVGRPVLVTRPDEPTPNLANAVVGWKDTCEAQRAVANALPFLKQASKVTVVEISSDEELSHARGRVQDVSAWLWRHGISAEACALRKAGDDAAHLGAFAKERDAGLLVAGAYGHNRLREWVFGGVTRDLLLRSERCSLVSH